MHFKAHDNETDIVFLLFLFYYFKCFKDLAFARSGGFLDSQISFWNSSNRLGLGKLLKKTGYYISTLLLKLLGLLSLLYLKVSQRRLLVPFLNTRIHVLKILFILIKYADKYWEHSYFFLSFQYTIVINISIVRDMKTKSFNWSYFIKILKFIINKETIIKLNAL